MTNENVADRYKISRQNAYKCNFIKIPVNYLEPTIDGMNEMNALIEWAESKGIQKLKRTPKGGIKSGLAGLGWQLTANKHGVELLYNCAFQLRVQFRHLKCDIKGHGRGLTGSQSFRAFNDVCKEFGIDLMDYWSMDNAKLKKDIESPIRWLNDKYRDKELTGVYHIDGNNMWFGQMIKQFPELSAPVLKLYREKVETTDLDRKQDIKDIFTHALGYCQSESCKLKAGLSQLAKAGVNGCNAEIKRLLKYYGDRVIAINTDGIWLKGKPNPMHLGKGIGEFKLDHANCRFRAISANKYEFMDNGEYHAVVSGLTGLDKIKSRDQWEWGDIYSTKCKVYGFKWSDKKRRIIYEENIEEKKE